MAIEQSISRKSFGIWSWAFEIYIEMSGISQGTFLWWMEQTGMNQNSSKIKNMIPV